MVRKIKKNIMKVCIWTFFDEDDQDFFNFNLIATNYIWNIFSLSIIVNLTYLKIVQKHCCYITRSAKAVYITCCHYYQFFSFQYKY